MINFSWQRIRYLIDQKKYSIGANGIHLSLPCYNQRVFLGFNGRGHVVFNEKKTCNFVMSPEIQDSVRKIVIMEKGYGYVESLCKQSPAIEWRSP
jgi:hypothetical protein